jgi:hypothetical protein
LAGIQREAGNKAEEAEDALASFRSDKFDPDESTDRIWKWLFLGMESRRADGQPIDANGNPITDMDTTNKNALIAEIARLTTTRPNEIPFHHFIENSKFKELRKQAVTNLRIP